MEERAKKRLVRAATAIAGLAYFLVCAQPLPKILGVAPRWKVSLDGLPSRPSEESTRIRKSLPFALGERFGFFDLDGSEVWASPRGYGVSLAEQGFVAYDRIPGDLTWKDPKGRAIFTSKEPGYPFMAGGRRFIIAPNQSTVSEIGNSGEVLWKRDFPSIITAFDASPGLALFGGLDGHLTGMDKAGTETLSFSPGGSRIEGIFGCAVSPNGRCVAAIAGLDKQRLVVLEKRQEAFRVTWHRWIDSDYRRPVSMAFTTDGTSLMFESPRGVGIYRVTQRTETFLPATLPSWFGLSDPERRILATIEGRGLRNLLLGSVDGRRLYSIGFSAQDTFLAVAAKSIFLGTLRDDGAFLERFEFVEE